MITLKRVLYRFRRNKVEIGPKMYLDLNSFRFFKTTPLFALKQNVDPSARGVTRFARIIKARQMSPFRLNLNLNPLYTIRGGSTTRADPLTKYPTNVRFRWKPL